MSSTHDLFSYRPNRQTSLLVWMLLVSFGSVILLAVTISSSLKQNIDERNENVVHTTRIVERSITRTLESVETTLRSLAQDLHGETAEKLSTGWARDRIKRAIQFSPHIRQIILLSNDTILVDSSERSEGLQLSFDALHLMGSSKQLNNGLNIGRTVQQRFLPIQGEPSGRSSRRSLIPLSFTVSAYENKPVIRLVVALNASYLAMLFTEGRADETLHVGLVRSDGVILLNHNLMSDWGAEIQALVKSDRDEQARFSAGEGVTGEYVVQRLSSRYAVALVQEVVHSDTLYTWLERNRQLLFFLIIALVAIIAATWWLIWDSRSRRVLEAEVGLLFEAIDQSPVTIVITDNNRMIRYINPAFTRMMGLTEQHVLGNSAAILKSGETPESTYKSLRKCLEQGQSWSGEFINRTLSGERITVACTVSSVRNAQGKVTHHVGVMADVSAAKEADKELRIAAASFEVQAGMIVTDEKGIILRVNPAFTQMTGYSANEVIGRTPAVLRSGQHGAAFYQEMYACLNEDGFWEGEIWNRRKSGEIYPEWLVVSTVLDVDGEITNFVGSFTDISERKAAEEKITRLAFYDPLTKLPNRRLFNDRLPHVMHTSSRSGQFGALMMLDLDHFKAINDTKGHDVGDALLVDVSNRLTHILREGDSVIRMGGDEFLVMLENLGTLQELAALQIERVATKILEHLAAPYVISNHEFRIGASIGIELFRGTDVSSDDILKHADIALYESKDAGRNTFRFFRAFMLDEISAAVEMTQALRNALDQSHLDLYVQPQVDSS